MKKLTPSQVVIFLATAVNYVIFALVGEGISAERRVHIGNWIHDFTTGPGIAGIAAVIAAGVAYKGIMRQVKETAKANRNAARANSETARKNRESQWWDTLKWTYTEAKDTQSNGDGAPPNKTTFRGIAAVRILESLNQDHDTLTIQQRGAIEGILSMFAESKDPNIQDATDRIFASFGRSSPTYDRAVLTMLHDLNLEGVTISKVFPLGREADYIIRSAHARVAVLVKAGESPASVNDVNQLLTIVGSKRAAGKEYTAGLLINEAGMTHLGHEVIQGSLKRVSTVRWQPGMSVHEVESILTDLLLPE